MGLETHSLLQEVDKPSRRRDILVPSPQSCDSQGPHLPPIPLYYFKMGSQHIQPGTLQNPWKTAAAVLPHKCCSFCRSGVGCIAAPASLYGHIMGVLLGGRATVQVPGHDGGRGPCLHGSTTCSGVPHDSMEQSGSQLH